MKALVVNALGRGFDLEDVGIATPIGREPFLPRKVNEGVHTCLQLTGNGHGEAMNEVA